MNFTISVALVEAFTDVWRLGEGEEVVYDFSPSPRFK